jgi:hypothetical protein
MPEYNKISVNCIQYFIIEKFDPEDLKIRGRAMRFLNPLPVRATYDTTMILFMVQDGQGKVERF